MRASARSSRDSPCGCRACSCCVSSRLRLGTGFAPVVETVEVVVREVRVMLRAPRREAVQCPAAARPHALIERALALRAGDRGLPGLLLRRVGLLPVRAAHFRNSTRIVILLSR